MAKVRLLMNCFCILALAGLFGACSLNYTVKDPVPSSVTYNAQKMEPTVLTIVDQRTGRDSSFLLEQLGAGASMKESKVVKLNNIEDPIAYFALHLEKELNNRRIAVKCVVGKNATDGLSLTIKRYQIANLRATGFSPWESFHIFSGLLTGNGRTTAIKSYFYNGKVPVWSMNEILEPCFETPISIIIKDVAAKINQAAFNLASTDQQVEALDKAVQSQIAGKDNQAFWKVLELGYTNNPAAVEPLKKFSQTGDEFFRACAISSIGTLKAKQEAGFLQERYHVNSFNDRYMAVKALGDLDTPEALQMISGMKKDPAYEKEGGLKYVVDLYLP